MLKTKDFFLKKLLPYYFLGLGLFTAPLLMVEFLRLKRLVTERNVDLISMLDVFLHHIPLVLQFTLAPSVAIGIILAIALSSYSDETSKIKVFRFKVPKVVLPSILLGLILTVFSLAYSEWILPLVAESYAKSRRTIYQINPMRELGKSLSFRTIDGLLITVDGVNSKTKELVNVRVKDFNNNKLTFAPRGLILEKDYEKNAFPLILFHSTTQPDNIKYPGEKGHLLDRLFIDETKVQRTLYILDRPTGSTIAPAWNQFWSLSQFNAEIDKQRFRLALRNIRDYNILNRLQADYREKKKAYDDFVKTHEKPSDPKEVKEFDKLELSKRNEYQILKLRIKRIQGLIKHRMSPDGQKLIQNDRYLFHRKIAFSFSALILALFAILLGLLSRIVVKSFNYETRRIPQFLYFAGVFILVLFIYYFMYLSGNYLIEKSMSPVTVGWIPNLFFLLTTPLVAGVLYFIHQRIEHQVKPHKPIQPPLEDHKAYRHPLIGFFITTISTLIILTIFYIGFSILIDLSYYISQMDRTNPNVTIEKLKVLYLSQIPFIVLQASPFAFLLAVLYTLARYSKYQMAYIKAGIRLNRLKVYILSISLVYSILLIPFTDSVIVSAYDKSEQLNREIRNRVKRDKTSFIETFGHGNIYYFIRRYEDSQKVTYYPIIAKLRKQDSPSEYYFEYRIDGEKAVWDESKRKWILYNGEKRYWDKDEGLVKTEKLDKYILHEVKDPPEHFIINYKEIDRLTCHETNKLIRHLKLARRKSWTVEIDLYTKKITDQLSLFIVVLIGIGFSGYLSKRFAFIGSLFLAIAIHKVFYFIYELTIGVIRSVG
ncbi:MAG TPA: LptF/LptG family permease [Spirochaetes bacterium]|nr:LptF/LptG family permease [Spirochaetota bacterium]